MAGTTAITSTPTQKRSGELKSVSALVRPCAWSSLARAQASAPRSASGRWAWAFQAIREDMNGRLATISRPASSR